LLCYYKSAETDARRQAAEERRKLEEKLAGAEKIDVSKAKDQGVIKQVLTHTHTHTHTQKIEQGKGRRCDEASVRGRRDVS
jgi:hypothetical protein